MITLRIKHIIGERKIYRIQTKGWGWIWWEWYDELRYSLSDGYPCGIAEFNSLEDAKSFISKKYKNTKIFIQ